MREFMLDSEVRAYRAGRGRSSSATIRDRRCSRSRRGSVLVEVDQDDPVDHRADRAGLDLRRGRPDLRPPARRDDPRRRGCDLRRDVAHRRAQADGVGAGGASARSTRISVERQLLQMFGSGLTPADLAEVLDTPEIETVRAGQPIITEGEEGEDIFVIRVGIDDRREEYRRQAGVPLLSARPAPMSARWR